MPLPFQVNGFALIASFGQLFKSFSFNIYFHGCFYDKYVKLPQWNHSFSFPQISFYFSPKPDNKQRKTDALKSLSLFSPSKIQKAWSSIRLWTLLLLCYFSYASPSGKAFFSCELYVCVWNFKRFYDLNFNNIKKILIRYQIIPYLLLTQQI